MLNQKLKPLLASCILCLSYFLFSIVPAVAAPGDISTVAGNGIAGYSGDGGPAASAQLSLPHGVAVDASGNLYIADVYNHRVRKVDTGGTITTVVGNGGAGYSGDGGPATAASLYWPVFVAIDAVGNLYITDSGTASIRKVDASGIITTIAGNGIPGYSGDGGLATSASFNWPFGVVVDASGNVYIADLWNHRIRRVDTSGMVTTIAGNGVSGYSGDGGLATSASINAPYGIDIDDDGNIYIGDHYNGRIRKVDTAGIITTVAGGGSGGDGGPATAASLNGPEGVAVDESGNIFIADHYNGRIRKVDTAGIITTVAGVGPWGYSGDGGPATLANLSGPSGIAVDAVGNIFIADSYNNRVRKVQGGLQEFSIDIKPGSMPNSINPKSSGKIPVAILSKPDFEASASVNINSLTFGHAGTETSLAFCNSEDVNGDGLNDLMCHFYTQQTGFQSGDTTGTLKGLTTANVQIVGQDSVNIVGK